MSELRRILGAYPTMLRVGFAHMTAYRAEVVVWILTTTMPLIMYAIWATIAEEAPVGRFDQGTFASYFLMTLIVRQLSSAWVVWELNELIRSGRLSTPLLKPMHPLLYLSAENLGVVPYRVVILVVITIGSVLVIPGISVSKDPLHWLLFVWSIFGSWLLTFTIQSLIGLLALYTEQSLSIQEAWFGLWAFLSGYLIPLEVMPAVQHVAVWLPFRSMGSLPTEIALGHLAGAELMQGLLVQAAWALAAVIALLLAWPKAMRRFEAYG